MKGKCAGCRKFEEDIYWTRFNSMHFCQFVSGDFRSQLMLPKKFSDKMRGKLHKKVTLMGPSGATWDLGLVANDDALFLRDGWEEFASAYFLKENDIVMFRYKGKSEFDVFIIDGPTLCENEASCFAKKCGHDSICCNKDQQVGNLRKECSVEIIHESPPEDDNHVPPDSSPTKKLPTTEENAIIVVSRPRRSTKKAAQDHLLEDGFKESPSKKPRKEFVLGLKHQDAPYPRGSVRGWELSTSVKFPKDLVVAEEKKRHPTNLRYPVIYSSNRRHVTEEEKKTALLLALQDLTEDSFMTVMRATHAYKRFYLSMPQDWLMKHFTRKQDVKLRVKEKTWIVRLIFSSSGRAGLSRGWKQFALDNYLEEFDVCLFKLASSDDIEKQKPSVLDVSIYRVVPEIVPPTRLTAPLLLKHKRSRVSNGR